MLPTVPVGVTAILIKLLPLNGLNVILKNSVVILNASFWLVFPVVLQLSLRCIQAQWLKAFSVQHGLEVA